MDARIQKIKSAAQELRSRIGGREPFVGIVLGSGLDELGDKIEDAVVVPFIQIPGFPRATALGHKGNFVCGYINGKCVLAMQGRYHAYEGLDMDTITLPTRVMAELGVRYFLVSNASGGCNPSYEVGDLMLIRDHINLLSNPLIGPNMDDFGTRFPDMTCAYDLELQDRMTKISEAEGIKLQRGVYLACTGPTYETPAEYHFFRLIGADTVGMSTIPEVIVARHCGMRVLGMSVVTDMAPEAGAQTVTDGDEILRIAAEMSAKMSRLFSLLIATLD